ncbi:MAG: hypothetical protein M9931_03715 [Chitinophagales bacterium]|nr:hypothetical protein [Chitinophagales bacterium]MCO5280149.1 hypothetical protein [Chitinophagales bacterium]OJV25462.1 MAG: hypothetical protein BGO32_00110 [Bacteroidetes bacterium 37-13]HRN95324.1 hypothetical protein [Chitinophagales bacterium]HRP38044.1 hypothetical protein [Chitinophagales bacterium]
MLAKGYLIIIASFVWIGFLGGISFLESWLKFKAPGITIPLGLGIGRLVFSALNKIEWVLAAIIVLNLAFRSEPLLKAGSIAFFVPVVLLVIQTIWLLPAMDARAQLVVAGKEMPPSHLHIWFVGMETIKVASLFTFGLLLLKQTNK